MRITFSIPYNTTYGQVICINGLQSNNNREHSLIGLTPMKYSDGKWIYLFESNDTYEFEYSYVIKNDNGTLEYECGPLRKFIPEKGFKNYSIIDQWKPFTDESPFSSYAFKNVFFMRDKNIGKGNLVIKCNANNIPSDTIVALCGDGKWLGKWNPEKSLPLYVNDQGVWEIRLDSTKFYGKNEYKFLLIKNYGSEQQVVTWEHGDNRSFEVIDGDNSLQIFNNFTINLPAQKARFAGTAIPVFSIRSKTSFGCGDFSDIIKFCELLKQTGQRVLQILPINDTTMSRTWQDSYPYGAITVYALHPIYLNPLKIGVIEDEKYMKSFISKADKLNNLSEIDYDAVLKLKWDYFNKIFSQEWEKTSQRDDYKLFFEKNREWLINYSAFCYLRDKFKTADFSQWGDYSIYSKEKISNLTDPNSKTYQKTAIHLFLQYHLHLQLSEAHRYANDNGIILKGDIPIGINKNSVEAWVEPHLFNFSGQAGAPPDDFSVRGQNWGFPTYNWGLMEKDGYKWWKQRFSKMAEYFDAYRIDHILGFFRIWEVPSESVEGIMGHFNPSLPFSADELRGRGYNFNYDRDCLPYIKEYMLDEYFGYDKESVKNEFLEDFGWQTYKFKEQYNTQKKIETYLNENLDSIFNSYKETLFALISEVLFVQEPTDHSLYHPRISAQFTKSYKDLPYDQKSRFNEIYNHFYYERNNDFWYSNAMKRLPSLISSTGMLVCGEDLGMIPACVPSVMKSLSITSLEIQRMPKDPEEKFGNTYKYPYLSVCATGTHDTSTLRQWWEEDYESSRRYYSEVLGENGTAPLYCEPWLSHKILKLHLDSPSMLTVLPLQDWLSAFGELRRENPNEERINIPSNPKHYWRYRMHINIEDLVSHKGFLNMVKDLVWSSGRI
jgi:4-alpha-glucanotransferase